MPSRKSRNSVRKTRKARGLTVESLHASFERIDKKVHALIAKGASDSELASCLHSSWSEQFHMPVSASAVKALIMHYRAVHSGPASSKRMTRRKGGKGGNGRGQRGGMAPLDYMMGPGLTSQSYGRFPVEMGVTPNVVKDLDLGRFYESNAGRSCNTTGGHPAINQRGGSGGSLWDQMMAPSNMASTLYNGHPPISVPVNTLQGITNAVQGGAPLSAPATPVAPSVHLSNHIPRPFDGNVTDLSKYATIYKA